MKLGLKLNRKTLWGCVFAIVIAHSAQVIIAVHP